MAFGVLLGMYTSPRLTLRRGGAPFSAALARTSPAGPVPASNIFFRAGTDRRLRDPVEDRACLFVGVASPGAVRAAFCWPTGAALLGKDWVEGRRGGLWAFFTVFWRGDSGSLGGAGLGPAGAASLPPSFAPNSCSSCLKRFSNISKLSGPFFFLEEPRSCFFFAMGQSSYLGGPVTCRERRVIFLPNPSMSLIYHI